MDEQQNSKVQVEVGRMSRATLAGGAAVEKFDAELERVLPRSPTSTPPAAIAA